MDLKLLIITVLTLCPSLIWAQIDCYTDNTHEAPLSYEPNSSSGLRKQATRIAILPTIVHQSNGNQVFTEADVQELIQKANTYFAPIKYEFYIANQGIRHVYNDEFYNLEIEQENELRELYDVDYAINLYFIHLIKKPNKDILNGFSSLPSLNGLSNRIMLSYLDKNKADFESLRDKIFPHELGHYFGLLHTFQDSNNEAIEKRELVTRGIGSNCSHTGDYLCDTDADPFERFPSISTLGCDNRLPSNFTDALGSSYSPPSNNIMSYNIRCDHVFTTQQYERMEAAGSVRFSPDADYQLVQQENNSITIGNLSKRLFCAGETISFDWKSHGFYNRNNTFSVEFISEVNDVITMDAAFFDKEVFVQVPKTITPNSAYRMRIVAANPSAVSPWSEHFEIQNVGTAALSTLTNEVNSGEQISLNLEITGSGPWDISLSDGTNLQNIRSSNFSIFKTPVDDISYSISSISNKCGNLDKKGLVNIKVAAPSLLVNGGNDIQVCEEGYVELPVDNLIKSESNNYRIILKGDKDFLIVPITSTNKLFFNIPREIGANETVSLKIKGEGFGNFSSPVSLTILEKPRQPFIQSPVSFCFEKSNAQLTAEIEGDNQTRWYNESLALIGTQGLVNTSSPGIRDYFVSQISSAGCESEKSKVEVEIKEPLQAYLSGDQNIFQGDSAQLKLDIAGEGPFEVVLNDGSIVSVNQPSMLYYVKPTDSYTYEIKNVKNECGFGQVQGQADIQVIVLLSSLSQSEKENILYPNPSKGVLHSKSDFEVSSIVDIKGQEIPFTQDGNTLILKHKGVLFITAKQKGLMAESFTQKLVIH